MNIKIDDSFFSRLPNLEMHSVLSTASNNFFGLEMQQHPLALFKLNQLLRAVKFDRIIEIGCLHGGMSYMFALYASLSGITFKCYDIQDMGHHIKLLGKCFEKKDVLNDSQNVAELKTLIASPGRTLILCDAGKALEYNIYADSMKSGDFIMTHDFAPDKETFQTQIENRVWNWLENWYERIEEATVRNNIIHTTYFNDVVWSCGWKE